MKSSQNSETPSSTLSPEDLLEAPITSKTLLRSFERYGMLFEYEVTQETMPAWQMTKNEDDLHQMEWTLTGETRTTEFVHCASVRAVNQRDRTHGHPITLFTTSEGPILAIMKRSFKECFLLRHPALVQYTGGTLKLKPIFGADRELRLATAAITATQAPSELLLSVYSHYLVQSNMGGFLRTLPKPLHTHEEEIKPSCT